jgi:hypothetical protein
MIFVGFHPFDFTDYRNEEASAALPCSIVRFLRGIPIAGTDLETSIGSKSVFTGSTRTRRWRFGQASTYSLPSQAVVVAFLFDLAHF